MRLTYLIVGRYMLVRQENPLFILVYLFVYLKEKIKNIYRTIKLKIYHRI